jgi:hypothetical protein
MALQEGKSLLVASLFYTITGQNTSHRRWGDRPAQPWRGVAETPGLNQTEHHVPKLIFPSGLFLQGLPLAITIDYS